MWLEYVEPHRNSADGSSRLLGRLQAGELAQRLGIQMSEAALPDIERLAGAPFHLLRGMSESVRVFGNLGCGSL